MRKTVKPIDVLVGEANDGHAELVETSLRECGIVNNLYRGRNGEETLALARTVWEGCKNLAAPPSLVFLDCGLPEPGAPYALGTLKSDWRYSWIPVIMMSATDDGQQAEQYRHLGCEAYMTKWAVFLGLPGFVSRGGSLSHLADRWEASAQISDTLFRHPPL